MPIALAYGAFLTDIAEAALGVHALSSISMPSTTQKKPSTTQNNKNNKNQQNAELIERFLHWERQQPDVVYMTQPQPNQGVVDYTWAQVGDQARRMATYLLTLDLPPASPVVILGKNSAHWIMMDLAIWFAGHISVPLYPTLNAETARYILEHCEARLLVVGKMDELWPALASGIPTDLPQIRLPLAPESEHPVWDDLVAAHQPLQQLVTRSDAEMATILYTSGSTGKPKGVMTSFAAMAEVGRRGGERFKINTTDRMLSYLPLAHAAERALLEVPSLYHGFHIYFANTLATFVQDLQRARPTLFFSVPRLWTRFYQGITDKLPLPKQKLLFRLPVISGLVRRRILTQLGLQHVRLALTGSAPLTPALIIWYRELGLELLEGYGMSENFAYSHANVPGNVRNGYVGSPSPGVSQRIDTNGEILVKSPATMMGYFKAPELTAEVMTEDGFLRTGDMGELDAEGRLKITGRIKDLFKTSKGKYVAPVPIENLLGDDPLLEAVCVAGAGLTQPVGLLMLSAEASAHHQRAEINELLTGLLERVNERLEAHEQLDFLVVVSQAWTMENGFLTPTMKIRRNIIEERYQPLLEDWLAVRQPVIWET